MREEKDMDFERSLRQALVDVQNQDLEKWASLSGETVEFSFRHKRNMNRLFRKQFGNRYLPYPEAAHWLSYFRKNVSVRLSGWVKRKSERRK